MGNTSSYTLSHQPDDSFEVIKKQSMFLYWFLPRLKKVIIHSEFVKVSLCIQMIKGLIPSGRKFDLTDSKKL
jgi:hypothetical protein